VGIREDELGLLPRPSYCWADTRLPCGASATAAPPKEDDVNALRQRRYDRHMADLVRAHTLALRADLEGFLTRECPACSRHFKVRVADWFGVIQPEPPTLNDRSLSDGLETALCAMSWWFVVIGIRVLNNGSSETSLSMPLRRIIQTGCSAHPWAREPSSNSPVSLSARPRRL
jgi:hypothetical protein